MTHETQSAPRRQVSTPANAAVANSHAQRLHALVASSPQVRQLKSVGGWFSQTKEQRLSGLNHTILHRQGEIDQKKLIQPLSEQDTAEINQMENQLKDFKIERLNIMISLAQAELARKGSLSKQSESDKAVIKELEENLMTYQAELSGLTPVPDKV